MGNKIYICSIQDRYIAYLRIFDSFVRENKEGRRKYIGVLFDIDGKKYYAPLASPKPKYSRINDNAPDLFKIDNGRLGVINLNNMIPVPDSEITRIDIEKEKDEKYKNLLRNQANFIISKRKKIIDKAKLLYSIVNSGKHPVINSRCCNFKLLEIKCEEYSKTMEEVAVTIEEHDF
jgi:protein AbiQ